MRGARLALAAALAVGLLRRPAAAQQDFSVEYRATPESGRGDGASTPDAAAAAGDDDVLTVQTAFSDVPLVVPAALREPLVEALALYAQAGDWSSPALGDADKRHIARRMEALLAGPLPALHPVAMSLGNGLVALGNASSARHWFTACAASAAAAGDWVTAGIAAMNVGFGHAAAGEPRRALELLLHTALPLLQRGRPQHTAFWLGNTVAEAAVVLSRLPPTPPAEAEGGSGGGAGTTADAGGEDAAAALLDEWIARLAGQPFHRLRLLRGNLAWQARGQRSPSDKAAAWEHWLAGADEAAAAGDAVWRDRLLLTAYATASVAGFVGRPAGVPGSDAIRARMAPEAVADAGRDRGLQPVRALLACVRATAERDATAAAPAAGAATAACDVPAHTAAAVEALPWLVLAVTASRRAALWQHWLELEDAAVVVEAVCIAALLRGAQAYAASGDARHLALPPPLAACAASESLKAYALPYEHIGFGAGSAPFPPALLPGVGGIFTGTLSSGGDQRAAVAAVLDAGAATQSAMPPGAPSLQLLARRLRARRAPALTPAHRLHVGLLSFDLRAHASAWLAEGYVRHFNRSRVGLAALHYGPVDPGSALAAVEEETGAGGDDAAASRVGWRRVVVPPPPWVAGVVAAGGDGNAAPDGGPRPHALVAQLVVNATMSDRIASAADAAYVASPLSAPAEVLCAQMLSRHGPDGSSARSQQLNRQPFPLHIIDEHMGHTFGSRYGLTGPCRVDEDDGSGGGSSGASTSGDPGTPTDGARHHRGGGDAGVRVRRRRPLVV
jgi:hypothetical protein